MTVNRTWTDPSEAGTMDRDVGQTPFASGDTSYDLLLSNVKNLGSSDGAKARVTTQFDKTSDTTLANIPGLSLSLEAAGVYAFRAMLYIQCNSNGGAKVAIGGTCTATAIVYDGAFYDTISTTIYNGAGRQTALGGAVVAQTTGVKLVFVEGLITVNGAGTLTVQFAQNASFGTASSVLVGSYFEIEIHA